MPWYGGSFPIEVYFALLFFFSTLLLSLLEGPFFLNAATKKKNRQTVNIGKLVERTKLTRGLSFAIFLVFDVALAVMSL